MSKTTDALEATRNALENLRLDSGEKEIYALIREVLPSVCEALADPGWTTEPPTEVGKFYWSRFPGDSEPVPVMLVSEGVVCAPGDGPTDLGELPGTEWIGPISP